jgi:Tol biopolymer transport system component
MSANAYPELNAALAGRYTIEKKIGAGGMATVYLAHDVRHDRKVALKLLNADLGAVVGADRFLSEIRVTANLHHPNLLPLFDSGSVDGTLFYVMPLVEGESLRQRLDRERQLPVDEALRIASAVAGALDYAHQHGVIHRDLKPENILLQHGQPVVADFGIALALSNAGGERVTQTGLSLGTPQYMSPEQATGDRVIDARTDIYSLGAVTYEMLSGEPPHVGGTAQAIIAKLMTEAVRPVSVLRRAVPEHVDDAVLIALEKLPADRFATAGQFAAALNGTVPALVKTQHTRRLTVKPAASRAMMVALAATSALALIFATLWFVSTRFGDAARRSYQFVLDIPPDQQLVTANESAAVLSPDGLTVAYVARSTAVNAVQIFIRRLDSLAPRREGLNGNAPLFSPDGRWLYYRTATGVSRVPVNGGSAEVVTPLIAYQGYALSPAGELAFASAGSLYRLAKDGAKVLLISPDSTKGEASFAGPTYLDDENIAFWVQRLDGAPGKSVGLTTDRGGDYTVLNIEGTRTFGMVDGHLLVGTEQGTLLGYPLNLRRREITGPPVVLLDSAVWIITGGLQISIAQDGSLIYLRGRSRRSLALVERRGSTIAEAPEQAEYRTAALSPDGKRVAVAIARNAAGGLNVTTQDIWTWDIAGRTLARFTSDGGMTPAWSPDGKRIAYLKSTTPRFADLMWAPADGSGAPELLLSAPRPRQISNYSFAHAGRTLLVTTRDSADGLDIYSVDLASRDRVLRPLVVTRFNDNQGSVSPDGRLLAYVSNETGRGEVYLRPLGSPAGRVRVTTDGGNNPEWLDGNRLVYGDGGRRLIAEVRETGGDITAVVRDSLSWNGSRQAVDRKGERVLVAREPVDWRLVIVRNWVEEARKKLRH